MLVNSSICWDKGPPPSKNSEKMISTEDHSRTHHYAEALRQVSLRYERLVRLISILRQIDEFDDPTLEINEICRRLSETIAFGLAAENCSVMLLDAEGHHLELRGACSSLQDCGKSYTAQNWTGKKFCIGEGIIGRVQQSGVAARLDDVSDDEDFVSLDGSPVEIHSLMCFPLRADRQTIGVLNLSHSESGFFTLECEKTLALVADRSARMLMTHLLCQRLRESEEHYRLVSENAGDGILVFDASGRMLSANPAVEQITGTAAERYCCGEIDWKSRIHPEDRKEFLEHWSHVLDSNSLSNVEYRYLDARGEVQYLEQRSSPLEDPSGRFVGIVCVIRNATMRKRAEEALRVASRMEATATLAGGIAHDFNNLMVAVLGNAELLRIQFADHPDELKKLDNIRTAAQRAGELAQQMLAFARGGKYKPAVINLNDVVREVLQLEEGSVPSGVRMKPNLDADVWNVKADSTQMSQVVLNLCLNAVEAIQGNGLITVATSNLDVDECFADAHQGLHPGHHVCLSVEDTGNGMSPDTLSKVFEPFFTTKLRGRGLGLAAVYGIVKNHNGHISAHSEQSRGSVFKIYLPAVMVEAEKMAKPESEIPTGSETVLIIDDEEIVLDVVKQTLQYLGYRVLTAHNTEEALELSRTFDTEIHLALLDVGADGGETYSLLTKQRPQIKVIVCSGCEPNSASQSLLDAGARAFLQKPFRMHTVAREVRNVLDG